jgi:hypothetical protein
VKEWDAELSWGQGMGTVSRRHSGYLALALSFQVIGVVGW